MACRTTLPPQANVAPSLRLLIFPSFITQHQRHNMRSELRAFQVGLRNNLLIISTPQRCRRPDVATQGVRSYRSERALWPSAISSAGLLHQEIQAMKTITTPTAIFLDRLLPRLHSVRSAARGNVTGIKALIHRRFEWQSTDFDIAQQQKDALRAASALSTALASSEDNNIGQRRDNVCSNKLDYRYDVHSNIRVVPKSFGPMVPHNTVDLNNMYLPI
jgi:hypothetical protein